MQFSNLKMLRIFYNWKFLQKKVEVEHIPVEALQSHLDGAEDPMQKSFSGLMLYVANGDRIEMKGLLKTFSVKLTSAEEYFGSLIHTS
jgi:hypothetical protein